MATKRKQKLPLVTGVTEVYFVVSKASRRPFVLRFTSAPTARGAKERALTYHSPGTDKLPSHLEVRRFVVAEFGTEAAFAAFGAVLR